MDSGGVHSVNGPQGGGASSKPDTSSTSNTDPSLDAKLYDPSYRYPEPGKESSSSSSDSQPPPDTGSNSSDTTTQQNAIYFYKPFAMLPFPKANGPPVPYMDDFTRFQK